MLTLAVPPDFTYRELQAYSRATAVRLRRRLQIASRGGSITVGLLCSSSPEFILAWLGLMRLDVAVMLLAYVSPMLLYKLARKPLTLWLSICVSILQASA